jgi:hypothetical protein
MNPLFDYTFNGFTGFTDMLLKPAKQFLGLAFGTLEFVAGKLGLFLFQLALDDVKVAFDFERFHSLQQNSSTVNEAIEPQRQ